MNKTKINHSTSYIVVNILLTMFFTLAIFAAFFVLVIWELFEKSSFFIIYIVPFVFGWIFYRNITFYYIKSFAITLYIASWILLFYLMKLL